MDDLLQCLGWRTSRSGSARLLALFIAGGGAWVAATAVVHHVTGIGFVPLQLATWAAWFYWQGRLFPRHRRRDIREFGATAYRRAFWRDILPGVTCGAAQMMRPLSHGVIAKVSHGELPMTFGPTGLLGWVLFADGVLLLAMGFATIGPAAAGFVSEYRPSVRPLKQHSIYSCIRHPLFLGGALASIGGSLVLNDPALIAIAAVNVVVVPVYGLIEDYRLRQSFGEEYEAYATAVNRFIPTLRAVRTTVPVILDDARHAVIARTTVARRAA